MSERESLSDEELPPSKLGTKSHWDEVYEWVELVSDHPPQLIGSGERRECSRSAPNSSHPFPPADMPQDVGDEGEVWSVPPILAEVPAYSSRFGESSVTKMRQWADRYLPPTPTPIRVLECGSGNGTLLLSFLTSPPGSAPRPIHLTGIDYSPGAIKLARAVETARRSARLDEEGVRNEVEVEWRVGDLLHDEIAEQWDLVLDKGTFDALALSNEVVEEDGRLPSRVYPERVARLVREGGYFLITSCNFTEEEIRRRYTRPELGDSSCEMLRAKLIGLSGFVFQ